MIVMKFGGSSVADCGQIEKVLEIVRGRLKRSPLVVSSAHKGMTNALIDAGERAARGEDSASAVIDKQWKIAQGMGCERALFDPFFTEIEDLLRGVRLVGELSTRSLDYIASFGERMAVRGIADFFTRQGLKAVAFDSWELGFITDSNFGGARPLKGYEKKVQRAFARKVKRGVVPIVTGYIGKDRAGDITTLGRNGSDLSGTLFAAALNADEAEIWTDTDGIMTADPSVVKHAHNIPTLRFDEASELAYFGGRVLHPSTLLPAMKKKIPVRVLNTNRPNHRGTVILESPKPNKNPVTSIAYKEGQYVLSIVSTRMFGQSGFLAKVFEVLGRHRIVIDMIATSEISVSMTTDKLDRLNEAIRDLEAFGTCTLHVDKTLLCIVGQRLAQTPGIGTKILGAVAQAGVNVEMVSHGIGAINFSMLIDDADIKRAVPVLHDALFGRR